MRLKIYFPAYVLTIALGSIVLYGMMAAILMCGLVFVIHQFVPNRPVRAVLKILLLCMMGPQAIMLFGGLYALTLLIGNLSDGFAPSVGQTTTYSINTVKKDSPIIDAEWKYADE